MTIVPLIISCFYAHPLADDISAGTLTYQSWTKTHSVYDLLCTAWDGMINMYNSWQGSYTQSFFMQLQPGIFGENMYFLAPATLIVLMVVSHFTFFKIVLVKIFRLPSKVYTIITLLIIEVNLNFMPQISQGIYWFDGALRYTFFYCLGLFLLSVALLIAISPSKKQALIWTTFGSVLSFITAGGNYSTNLLTMLILFLFIYCLRTKKHSKYLWIVLISFCAGFYISVIAPGNMVRQSVSASDPNVLNTIMGSIVETCAILNNWNTLCVIAVFIGVIVPLLWHFQTEINDMIFSYKHPILFTILMCGLLAAQFCPMYYAYDNAGPLRTQNIIYFNYICILLFLTIYWCGWLRYVLFANELSVLDSFCDFKHLLSVKSLLVTSAVFFVGCISTGDLSVITSIGALKALSSGQLSNYDAQMNERLAALESKEGTGETVYINQLNNKPKLLCDEVGDLSTDSDSWINQAYSSYYEVEEVIVIPN